MITFAVDSFTAFAGPREVLQFPKNPVIICAQISVCVSYVFVIIKM